MHTGMAQIRRSDTTLMKMKWNIFVQKYGFTLNPKKRECIFSRLHTNNFWNVMSFLIFHISEIHNLRRKKREGEKKRERKNRISFYNFMARDRENEREIGKKRFEILVRKENGNGADA